MSGHVEAGTIGDQAGSQVSRMGVWRLSCWRLEPAHQTHDRRTSGSAHRRAPQFTRPGENTSLLPTRHFDAVECNPVWHVKSRPHKPLKMRHSHQRCWRQRCDQGVSLPGHGVLLVQGRYRPRWSFLTLGYLCDRISCELRRACGSSHPAVSVAHRDPSQRAASIRA